MLEREGDCTIVKQHAFLCCYPHRIATAFVHDRSSFSYWGHRLPIFPFAYLLLHHSWTLSSHVAAKTSLRYAAAVAGGFPSGKEFRNLKLRLKMRGIELAHSALVLDK